MSKYKISLSHKVYSTLCEDMVSFNYNHNGKEMNRNKFYLSIINGIYTQNQEKHNEIANVIVDKLENSLPSTKINELINSVTQKIHEIDHDEETHKKHPDQIYIQPNNEYKVLFSKIEASELNNTTISKYLRTLVNEYASLPMYKREAFIFKNMIDILADAKKSNRLVSIETKTGFNFKLQVYGVYPSLEETYNYLCGKNLETGNLFSVKISKIENITVTRQRSKTTLKDLDEFKKHAVNGPEFLSSDLITARVKFTNGGKTMYNKIYKDRPYITHIDKETGEYVFEADKAQLFFYLKNFGKHAVVLEPADLRDSLSRFFKNASDAYNE